MSVLQKTIARVHKFPTQTDRNIIKGLIRLYARSVITRQSMMTQIESMLVTRRVSKVYIDSFVVRRAKPVVTPRGTFPVIIIEANKDIYDRCPACDCGGGKYIAGEAPVVTFWCGGCGCIYQGCVNDKEIVQGDI